LFGIKSERVGFTESEKKGCSCQDMTSVTNLVETIELFD
jgi:hypothetical protein